MAKNTLEVVGGGGGGEEWVDGCWHLAVYYNCIAIVGSLKVAQLSNQRVSAGCSRSQIERAGSGKLINICNVTGQGQGHEMLSSHDCYLGHNS